jgi:hypothetical protein
MSIEYRIDHESRIVFAKGRDTFTDADAFGYQRDVWSRPELAGYHELMDMTDVVSIDTPSPSRVRDLALLSAAMDIAANPSKFAIVAPGDVAFGFGRMFAAHRESSPQSQKKEVAVFRSMAAALNWLCVQ